MSKTMTNLFLRSTSLTSINFCIRIIKNEENQFCYYFYILSLSWSKENFNRNKVFYLFDYNLASVRTLSKFTFLTDSFMLIYTIYQVCKNNVQDKKMLSYYMTNMSTFQHRKPLSMGINNKLLEETLLSIVTTYQSICMPSSPLAYIEQTI